MLCYFQLVIARTTGKLFARAKHLSRCGRKIRIPKKCNIQPRLMLLVDCRPDKTKFEYMLDGERNVYSQNIDKLTEGMN